MKMMRKIVVTAVIIAINKYPMKIFLMNSKKKIRKGRRRKKKRKVDCACHSK